MSYLEKGTEVFLSKKGYNGFFYPDTQTETLLQDSEVSQISWVGSMDLLPVLVPESTIYGSGNPDKMIPVWIKKGMLKSVKPS